MPESKSEADVVVYFEPDRDTPVPNFNHAEQSILDTVNRKVAARESLEELLEYLLESTRPISPCDRISLAFLDEDQRVTSHATVADYEPLKLRTGYSEDLARGTLRDVLHRGHPRIIEDLDVYLRFRPDSNATRLLVQEGVRSSLTCPLFLDERVIGVLFRSARRPNSYDARQASFFLQVAERLSQAIEKVRRIEQLEASQRAYNEMLGFVVHELKSPVASMVMNAQLLEEGIAGPLNSQQREVLQRSIRSGQHLLTIVGEYLDLARLESGGLDIRPKKEVDFNHEIIDPALEWAQVQFEQRYLTLEIDTNPSEISVEIDPELMRIVLTNLLSNAAKYTEQGGNVRLRVRLNHTLEVSVWNEGQGFTQAERNRLFRKFSRLPGGQERGIRGTGVGLYTVWRIVRLHGGRCWAESLPGKWAEFGFEIPQPLAPPGSGDHPHITLV